MMDALLKQGFVIASVDYALKKSYPQNIQDVVCSIQYLRAKASALHIDPDRIGIWGDSAGGHLAALAGLANQTGGFDSSAFPQISSKVQAVIDLYGPTIMATQVFGTEQANPIAWISKTPDSDPPFLIVHGALDGTVPVSDSQALYNALIAKGQPARLQTVEGADHGFFPNDSTINPSDAQITATMIDFFIQHLKPSQDQPTPRSFESSSGVPRAP
ncbi:MAG: alpha/beta hydrolase [Acetobacteraceae bacterium]|nr:alpha/beta hydrolase [Acetobacteraceae bacterium]